MGQGDPRGQHQGGMKRRFTGPTESCRCIGNPASGRYCPRLRGAQGSRGSSLCRCRRARHCQPIRINTLALGARLPTMSNYREYVEAGSLLSYGPNVQDLFHRAAEYVDKILRGAKPANLPVEQPTKFELIVNLNTAKALGMTIPDAFLLRADEVIE